MGIESCNTPSNNQGENMSLYCCMTFLPLNIFRCFVYSNLCYAVTTQDSRENNCVILHAQNTTVLRHNVFLIVVIGHKQEMAHFL